TLQFTRLADLGHAKDAPPARPQVFFVLSADKTLEINSPNDVTRLHEIQRREGNPDSAAHPSEVIRACEVQTPSQPGSPSPVSLRDSSVIRPSRCVPSGLIWNT